APTELAQEMPDVPGPTPEQAIAASSEIHLDDLFGPEAPWEERAGQTGELEQWVAETDDSDFDDDSFEPVALAHTGPRTGSAFRSRAGAACHAGLERVVGTDRADRAAEWTSTGLARVADVTRGGREKLRRSEHATLIVAIGGGALLIALLVAIGGALGGAEEAPVKKVQPSTGPLVQSPDGGATTIAPATTDAAKVAKAPAKDVAMVPAAKIRLNVFNAGAKKGLAKDVAAKLKGLGYGIGQVENSKGDYAGATIIHPIGMEREAGVIARHTGITTLEVAPGSSKDVTVVVV
ncbi:MAG: LytR cell envelope-related transcriptional attenuator, partial [Thermoleophilia bacterium]|nr:LytR cell envelope-related transcriptional attenuator [Thermoleophilia bacterium]